MRRRPIRAHPDPVVLVHGTFETIVRNWAVVSPRLKPEGYYVFALNYGNRGLRDINQSARELWYFVNNVLEFTGARKVSLAGHGQGGMMPGRWIKSQSAGNPMDDIVGFAPYKYGTEPISATSENFTAEDFGPPSTSGPCRACAQQSAGSRFLAELNRGDDTFDTTSYTQIATDEIMIPYLRCFLRGTERTRNLTLQDYYGPNVIFTHQNIYDPISQEFVLDALDNPGPTNPQRALADFPLS